MAISLLVGAHDVGLRDRKLDAVRLGASTAKRPEAGAKLFHEQLGLFPGSEMPALGQPVVVDEVRIRSLRPASRTRI
jgi:hypothetical protein